MTITLAQAIDEINAGPKTTSELLDIFRQLSGQATGATADSTYLLYTGTIDDLTRSDAVAKQIGANGDAITVSNTDGARLLGDGDFKVAYQRALLNEVLGDPNLDISQLTKAQQDAVILRNNLLRNGSPATRISVTPDGRLPR